jgi:hypothetical protein
MKKLNVIFIIALWFLLVLGGTFLLMKYQSAPGSDRLSSSSTFPSNSRLTLDPAQFTLILFAHPKCPCTRASIQELDRLMSKNQGKIKAYVIFARPAEMSAEWTDTDLKEHARRISGVEVLIDEEDAEILTFNAQTSGLTLLYDPAGKLRFRGGITFGRGMEGDSEGGEIISAILRGENPANDLTPVFGCALQNREIEIE